MTLILRSSIPLIDKGQPNGVATLDGTGKLPASQLPISAQEWLGNWDADTNTPTLSSGVGTNGDTYRVSVAGSTNLDGISDWQVGDQIVFNGTVWEKTPYTEDSDRVTNNSGVSGATVSDALDNLDSGKASTLQDAYDNSGSGRITTDNTIGAFKIRRGSASDSNVTLSVENGAGSTTFSVSGSGVLTAVLINGIQISEGPNASIQLGDSASVSGNRGVSIGPVSVAGCVSGDDVALGYSATTSGSVGAFAAAAFANAAGTRSTALGYSADATASNSVSVGYNSQSTGLSSVSILGNSSNTDAISISGTASGLRALALVTGSIASGDDSIAIAGTADGSEGIAIGNDSLASGSNAIVVGRDSDAYQTGITLGVVSGDLTSNSVGVRCIGEFINQTTFNNDDLDAGSYSTAIGRLSDTPGTHSVVLGNMGSSTADRSMLLTGIGGGGSNLSNFRMKNSQSDSLGVGFYNGIPSSDLLPQFRFARNAASFLSGSGAVIIDSTIPTTLPTETNSSVGLDLQSRTRVFKANIWTSIEEGNLTGTNAMFGYNETLGAFRGYDDGWVSFATSDDLDAVSASYVSSYQLADIDAGSATSGTCYAVKFIPESDITLSELEYYVTNANVGRTVYVGVYNEAGDTLIVEGSGNADAVGLQQASISSTNLTGGEVYWFAILEGNGAPNFGSQTVFGDNGRLAKSRFISTTPTGLPTDINTGFTNITTSFYIGGRS